MICDPKNQRGPCRMRTFRLADRRMVYAVAYANDATDDVWHYDIRGGRWQVNPKTGRAQVVRERMPIRVVRVPRRLAGNGAAMRRMAGQ